MGAIKFGTFEVKKDFVAPFQIDFSRVISNGKVAKEIAELMWQKGKNLSFDIVCGVPFVAQCFATFLAWEKEIPLVVRRTDSKAGKLSSKIEGSIKSGQRCLLLQDVSYFGEHTQDTIDDLEAEGISVKDVLTFLDLNFGGRKKLKSRGYVFHSVIGIEEVIQILFDARKLSGDSYKLACDFLETHDK